MSISPVDLPEDVESLRALALRQLDQNAQQLEQLTEQSERIAFLEEYIRLLKHQRFGRSSEKSHRSQLGLFNEAEYAADASDTEEAEAQLTLLLKDLPEWGIRSYDVGRIVVPIELGSDRTHHLRSESVGDVDHTLLGSADPRIDVR